jgi:acyl dehydratase
VSSSTPLLHGVVTVGDTLPVLVVDVTPTTVVLGALASRDWRPMHHDYKFATERNGVADIFLNTPNQAAWFERYLTDWTGPRGRVGRMTFRMRDSVFPGDEMTFTGTVTDTGVDDLGCGWVDVDVELRASARRAPPAWRSPWTQTTTPGPGRRSSGDRERGPTIERPTGADPEGRTPSTREQVITCWTWTSPRSRRCCGRWSAGCARSTPAATSSVNWRTTPTVWPVTCGRNWQSSVSSG